MYEMRADGLAEVSEAAAADMFLLHRPSDHDRASREAAPSGSALTVTLDGSLCIAVEVQALVSSQRRDAQFPARQRSSGLSADRAQLLTAVLAQHGGAKALKQVGQRDLFLNAVGGVRVTEPAADLAVVVAIASSMSGTPADPSTARGALLLHAPSHHAPPHPRPAPPWRGPMPGLADALCKSTRLRRLYRLRVLLSRSRVGPAGCGRW